MAKIKGTVQALDLEATRLAAECDRLFIRCKELTDLNAATELAAANMSEKMATILKEQMNAMQAEIDRRFSEQGEENKRMKGRIKQLEDENRDLERRAKDAESRLTRLEDEVLG